MLKATLTPRESRVDWPMWLAILGLMLVGTAFIYSATSTRDDLGVWQHFQESSFIEFFSWLLRQFYTRQLIAFVLGLGAAGVICLVDYHTLARWSLVVYGIGILLLVMVLTPGIGTVRFGARRWIDLGFLNFQPSEFAKLAFLLLLANFLSRPLEELREPRIFLKSLALMALPFVLILKEPDLGSALTLIPVGLTIMFVAGAPARYLKGLALGGAILVTFVVVDVLVMPSQWRFIPLAQYQRERILVYFGASFADPDSPAAEQRRARERQRAKTYNIEQAMISVGSGGLAGKGWREGTQNTLGYLPRGVAHNDFIFSVIAEESGFTGSLVVLSLYGVILFTGLRIASQARDRLGRLIASGIVALFFSHIFINIGMNIRLMPVTGSQLPLLSYGGTSVLCTLIAAGVLQNIYIYRKSL
jgi:rod shape determining protein RodA